MMDEKSHFDNATLHLSIDGDLGVNTAANDVGNLGSQSADSMLQRNKSTGSRQSSGSCGKTSINPNKVETEYTTKPMFSYKEGAFETAVELCQREVRNETDGNVRGSWLLTEIDHWDNEKERIVILTDHSILIVNFDFITIAVKEHKRIPLHILERIQIGDLTYPEKSLMPQRQHGGVRLLWNKNQALSFKQKWNPFSSDIPFTTFAHHPIMYHEKERETITYNVDDFYESLVQAVNQVYRSKRPGEALRVEEGPIVIESYASLASMVFNQSHLGFCRDRGGVSF